MCVFVSLFVVCFGVEKSSARTHPGGGGSDGGLVGWLVRVLLLLLLSERIFGTSRMWYWL